MENLVQVSSKPVLGLRSSPELRKLHTKQSFELLLTSRNSARVSSSRLKFRTFVFSLSASSPRRPAKNGKDMLGIEFFASVSSSQETTSMGVNPQISAPPPPSQFGSPLFWIGVGVGLSALFSWLASNLKKYAMQQAFNTLMGQMTSQNNQFSSPAFSMGSTSPSAAAPATSPGPTTFPGLAASPSSLASQATVTVDASATKLEAAQTAAVKDDAEPKAEQKKYAFVDVSPEETFQKSPFNNFEDSSASRSFKDAKYAEKATQNGVASQAGAAAPGEPQSTRKTGSILTVEALEKMMEDPTVQKMVYPYLPEEMRNPATFKWMLQNPQYSQQLQDMLNNMGGSAEWDNRMMDTLKNFDLSSPEVKQQFDQIGLTPEEVISKIMANPDVAMAFQNPRVQAAIMDCSQNPLSIAKYQNDKEVMDVFNKISELFPGVTGSP
ncbi:hypothetical protein Nepgr_024241 [Nepenthes gracilis]|uniref:Protein TIC 40, chloroplastic n=1 Tax=Nepenthes gracilis TaxID=150966 RepID=A0AAD3T2F2_NEPGR|nr:hypothetical protein Nepgr_024241 [Nepenthes gracilis]